MQTPDSGGPAARPRLRFLTPVANICGAAILAGAMATASCGGRALDGPKVDSGAAKPDIGSPTVICDGCAPTPLCSEGCQSVCACCPCFEGERSGDLFCKGGCYLPVASSDGGSPDATDARGADVHVDGWRPPAACMLPFEVGPCDALFPVFAYVNGACVPRTYGGCEGNGNRFSTLEECMSTCEGRPAAFPCPTGRVARSICVACGAGGGCAKTIVACALSCSSQATCPQSLPVCSESVCQWAGCI
jgi:hypothetical protein